MPKRSIPFTPKSFALGCAAAAAVIASPGADAQTFFVNAGPGGGSLLVINNRGGSAGPLGPLAIAQFNAAAYNGTGPANKPFAELVSVSVTLSAGMLFTQAATDSGGLFSGGNITLSAAGNISVVDAGVFTTGVVNVAEHTGTQSTGSDGFFGSSTGTATYQSPVGAVNTGLSTPVGVNHGPLAPIQSFVGNGGTLGIDVYSMDSSTASCSNSNIGSCSLGGFQNQITNTAVYITYGYQFVPGPSSLAMFFPGATLGLAAIRRRSRVRR